jgi:hypothetical protein
VQRSALLREAAEDHAADRRRPGQRVRCRGKRNLRRAIGGETVDAGRDGGKANRSKAVSLAEFDRAGVARGQRLIFAPATAVPDRADGVDDMPRRQPMAGRDFGLAGLATIEGTAFGQEFGAGSPMNRAIDATAAEQARVGGVDDGVNA